MPKIKEFRSLEEEILLLQKEAAKSSTISISEILKILSGKGRPLIVLFLCLPFCQPIQIPGFSTPFGLAIAFVGLRMAFGKKVWVPKKILERQIKSQTLIKFTNTALRLVQKIKPWIHPRLDWLCHTSLFEKLNGLLIVFLGLFLALPLPIPFSNIAAAWSIFFVAIGILEDDGLLVLLGYFGSLITFALLLFVVFTIKKLFV